MKNNTPELFSDIFKDADKIKVAGTEGRKGRWTHCYSERARTFRGTAGISCIGAARRAERRSVTTIPWMPFRLYQVRKRTKRKKRTAEECIAFAGQRYFFAFIRTEIFHLQPVWKQKKSLFQMTKGLFSFNRTAKLFFYRIRFFYGSFVQRRFGNFFVIGF